MIASTKVTIGDCDIDKNVFVNGWMMGGVAPTSSDAMEIYALYNDDNINASHLSTFIELVIAVFMIIAIIIIIFSFKYD